MTEELSKDVADAVREKLQKERKNLTQLLQKQTRIDRDVQESKNKIAALEKSLGY